METNCEIRYMESDRANAAERELAAERERRENAEQVLRLISGIDPEIEDYFAEYLPEKGEAVSKPSPRKEITNHD